MMPTRHAERPPVVRPRGPRSRRRKPAFDDPPPRPPKQVIWTFRPELPGLLTAALLGARIVR